MRYSGTWFRAGGLLVALLSFGITRLVVAETIRLGDGLPYLLVGLVPLVFGLGLTAYGVALAVGPYPASYVRIVATWCVLGTLGMAVVLIVSASESLLTGAGLSPLRTSPVLTSNTLLAGAIGGTAIGRRTASIRRQQAQNKRQANRALLLDRLLRHEVLNAVTSIRLWAGTIREPPADTDIVQPIMDASDRIARTIVEVAELIEEDSVRARVDLARLVSNEIDERLDASPDVELVYQGPASGVHISADTRLKRVIHELVTFASHDADASEILIEVDQTEYIRRLRISYPGGGLSEADRQLLTAGKFPAFDDPTSGFSLPIVRILVREYDGQIDLPATDGTAIELRFPKPNSQRGGRAISVSTVRLGWAVVTGLLAGVAMGGYLYTTSDVVPVIGALYGVQNPVIAWTTHLFHSVVFAMIFAAVGTHSGLRRYVTTARLGPLGGTVWGMVLWLVAAGVVMPIWLVAIGIPTDVPNLPLIGLVSHIIWGATLGLVYPFSSRIEAALSDTRALSGPLRRLRSALNSGKPD